MKLTAHIRYLPHVARSKCSCHYFLIIQISIFVCRTCIRNIRKLAPYKISRYTVLCTVIMYYTCTCACTCIYSTAGSSYSVPLSTSSERAARQEILQVPIDMANIVHKFAVLDVVQRMSLSHWDKFSSFLGLGKETVEVLSREKAVEERYYKSIKEWLKTNRERATFAALNGFLDQCSEHRAQVVMRKRLECNRDTLRLSTT